MHDQSCCVLLPIMYWKQGVATKITPNTNSIQKMAPQKDRRPSIKSRFSRASRFLVASLSSQPLKVWRAVEQEHRAHTQINYGTTDHLKKDTRHKFRSPALHTGAACMLPVGPVLRHEYRILVSAETEN